MSDLFEICNGRLKLKNGPGCYKITEDALWLLSCLPLDCKRYLEVGCATGIISLLLKLKNQDANIDAIDIQTDMIQQALEHKNINDVEGIDFKHTDLFDMPNDGLYDCVFSNPPYYKQDACCKINDCTRSQALIQEDICKYVNKMLNLVKPGGVVCFIGHCTTRQIILECIKNRHTLKEIELISKKNKTGKRFIYVLKKDNKDCFESKKIESYCHELRDSVLFKCKCLDLN